MSHLIRVDRRYYYRARVPVDLLCLFWRTEIRKSLRTGSYRKAWYLASELDYKLEVAML